MNNAGYKSFVQWQNSRAGNAYIKYNDSKQLLKAAESMSIQGKSGRQSISANTKSSKTRSKVSNNFRKKYSKILDKPLEKIVTFQLIEENRVDVKLNFFPEPNIISIFREHQMVYDSELKEWVLPFSNYINLFKTLMNLGEFKLNPIPANTIDIIFEGEKLEQIKFLNQTGIDSKSKKVTYIIDYKEDCQHLPKLNDLPKNLLKSLYRFQKQGIIFGIKKFSRLLIADEMGVGKTVQAIGLSSLYQKDWPVLVICPSSLKFVWRDEVAQWLSEIINKNEIQVIKQSKNEFKEKIKYYIISYDLSVRMIEKIIEKKFQYIIADEAHYLKSRTAKRTMCLTPILQRAKRVVLLTGTPILAKPMEIFPLLHILRPDKYKGFKEFGMRYCDPKILRLGLVDWSGSSNSRELNSILNKLMIRRLKKDVLNQLPPKKRQKIEISTDSKIIKKLKMILEKSSKKFEQLLGTQIELDKLGINIDDLKTEKEKEEENKSKNNDKEEESVLNRFSKAYSMTGQAKLPGVKDYVNYLVDNSCKFLIFAHHAEILDAIEEVIINDKIDYIRIDGKVPIDKRPDLVNKFQNEEDCLVAILSITACATGLTLTKASTVVFAELHFTPSIMIQAEDRAHRIGQENGCVNIHYLFGADTLDVLLFRKLNEKQNIVSTTLDNKSKDLDVTKIKEQVGDFINLNGKQISIDDRKNITQVVDKSNTTIKSFFSSKSQLGKQANEKNINTDNNINNNNINDIHNVDNNKIDIEKENLNFNKNLMKNDSNEEIENIINEEKEIINKDDIINNLNLHEYNGRRKADYNTKFEETTENTNNIKKIDLEEDENNKNNDDNNNGKKGKKKKKKKNEKKEKKEKKNKKKNKSMDKIKEKIKEEKNNEENNNFEDENFINNILEEERNEEKNENENIINKILEEKRNEEKIEEDKNQIDIFEEKKNVDGKIFEDKSILEIFDFNKIFN